MASCDAELHAIVAIPVCNERAHIAACLLALGGQRDAAPFGVLLFLNNCTDGTRDVIAATAPLLSCPLRIVALDHSAASAGWARRHAMEAAADWLMLEGHDNGVLLTTDADSCVPPDWIARNLAALEAGADAVAGRLALDPKDAAALPPALHVRGALEAEYDALLTEITARLDPMPGNPWPSHACRSGASLATRLRTYRAIGGMPDLPCGEDRAFIEAVLAHDGLVRYDPDIVVVTSARFTGRAEGGVADTLRRRCDDPESPCDQRLEPLGRAVARALLHARLRRWHAAGRRPAIWRLARCLSIGARTASRIAALPAGGAIYAALEAESPWLVYRPLRPSALPRQIRRARKLAAWLRLGETPKMRPAARVEGAGRPAYSALD